MVYRETAKTRAKAEARRNEVERATRHVIARSGFASASIAAVTAEAGCSTGLVYTYFANRDEMLGRAFALAAHHELAVVSDATCRARTVPELVTSVVDVFVRRAVTGRVLAHSLLFEPVPVTVQRERMALRRGYVATIAAGLNRLRPSAEVGAGFGVSAEVAARSLVGTISENLVDILDTERPTPNSAEVDSLIAQIAQFARGALGEA